MSAQSAAVPEAPQDDLDQPPLASELNQHALAATLAVITIAVIPRVLYLFLGGDPQNAGDGMTDTYHHWQIGFLTSQVGLSHGLRLWDLKGLEYFWGLLHPLILVVAFAVTRSIDIVIPRLVSILFGSLSVGLLFQICRRYWGINVAAAASAFAALSPPLIFSDALGMVEPVAVALVLLGIYLMPARGFLAGGVWGLAAMARAEAWIFTLALVIAAWLRRVTFERWLALAIGWLLVIGVYMKILLDRTGNPIYPVYWEFLVEVLGRWLSPVVTSQAHAVQPLFIVLVGLSGLGLAITLWRRPASYLFLCYGFGATGFVMGLLAFTPFLSSWSTWVWRLRVLAFPLDFGFVLLVVAVFLTMQALFRKGLISAWAVIGLSLAAVQLTWLPIQQAYWQTESAWTTDLSSGRLIAAVYRESAHSWGVVNIPADQPTLTYVLARFGGVQGDQVVGQLYDPFYALPAGYRYDQHPATTTKLLACWLRDTRTSIFVVPDGNLNYRQFVADHPSWFADVARINDRAWTVLAIASRAAIASACS